MKTVGHLERLLPFYCSKYVPAKKSIWNLNLIYKHVLCKVKYHYVPLALENNVLSIKNTIRSKPDLMHDSLQLIHNSTSSQKNVHGFSTKVPVHEPQKVTSAKSFIFLLIYLNRKYFNSSIGRSNDWYVWKLHETQI